MRNAEASKERILGAAMAEFSAYGMAGARVDRIAGTARCNKNLIYIYFESKEKLFSTVLEKHLARAYEEIPFTPDDLPGYAARLFDFSLAHPDLMRLLVWSGLERKTGDPAEHNEKRDAKISAITKAQRAGELSGAFPPRFVLIAVMSIATAWSAASPFGSMIDPDAVKRSAALRKHIAEAVRILTVAR